MQHISIRWECRPWDLELRPASNEPRNGGPSSSRRRRIWDGTERKSAATQSIGEEREKKAKKKRETNWREMMQPSGYGSGRDELKDETQERNEREGATDLGIYEGGR